MASVRIIRYSQRSFGFSCIPIPFTASFGQLADSHHLEAMTGHERRQEREARLVLTIRCSEACQALSYVMQGATC